MIEINEDEFLADECSARDIRDISRMAKAKIEYGIANSMAWYLSSKKAPHKCFCKKCAFLEIYYESTDEIYGVFYYKGHVCHAKPNYEKYLENEC